MYDATHFHDNPRRDSQQVGRLEVICGSMFSGKTEEAVKASAAREIREATGGDIQAGDGHKLLRGRGGVARPEHHPLHAGGTFQQYLAALF
jgi:hypothetical protein